MGTHILPSTSFFILIFLSIFEKFPEWHNYPKRINDTNAKAFYLTSRKLVNQLKNISVIVFSLFLYNSIALGMCWGTHFSVLILLLIFIMFIIMLIIYFLKVRQII